MKQELLTAAGGSVTGATMRSVGRSAMFTVLGTFDSASVAIEISIDGTTWTAINDSSGSPIAITAATQDVRAEEIKQEFSVRAVTSGGGGSTVLTVTMVQ